jgi:uncharacterized protein (TIGR00369 family)
VGSRPGLDAILVRMRAEQFEPLSPEAAEHWSGYPHWDGVWFPTLVGLQLEEVRDGYCRLRLPFRPELNQPAGIVHGGATATLIDSVVVPAVGVAYEDGWSYVTVTMNINYTGAIVGEDAIAEGWVTKRGRSIVFLEAEVTTASGTECANATLIYQVRPPRD